LPSPVPISFSKAVTRYGRGHRLQALTENARKNREYLEKLFATL